MTPATALERLNAPELLQISRLIFFGFFFVLGFLFMSSEELAVHIDSDGSLFAIPVYDCVVNSHQHPASGALALQRQFTFPRCAPKKSEDLNSRSACGNSSA